MPSAFSTSLRLRDGGAGFLADAAFCAGGGCVTCHEVAVHDSDDLLARYQVVPVRLTPDFFAFAARRACRYWCGVA